jgi:hypothetical protein
MLVKTSLDRPSASLDIWKSGRGDVFLVVAVQSKDVFSLFWNKICCSEYRFVSLIRSLSLEPAREKCSRGRRMDMNMLSRVCLVALVLLSGCDNTDPDKASRLVNLTLSQGVLTPDFSSNVTSYTALVGQDVESVTVTVTAADSDTVVFINGTEVSPNQGSHEIPLNLGSNTITIYSFYVDYATQPGEKTYVVVVTRQAGSWSVGGTLSGLSGVLALENNGTDELVLTGDGPFAFAAPLPDGDSYDVIVTAQPAGQTCNITNAQGAITGAAVSNIAVECLNTP